jgi:hypothetical protein
VLTVSWTMYQRVAIGAYDAKDGFQSVIEYNGLLNRDDFVKLISNNVFYVNKPPEIAG